MEFRELLLHAFKPEGTQVCQYCSFLVYILIVC